MVDLRVVLAILAYARGIENDGVNTTLSVLFLRKPGMDAMDTNFLFRMAERDLRAAGRINKTLQFRLIDQESCPSDTVAHQFEPIKMLTEMYCGVTFDAIIGPHCSAGMMQTAQLAKELNTPIIGYLSDTKELSIKEPKYTTLARVSLGIGMMGEATATVIKYCNWTQVAILWDKSKNGVWDMHEVVSDGLASNGISVTVDLGLDGTNLEEEMKLAVQTLKNSARIIIVIMHESAEQNLKALQTMREAQMTDEYFFLIPSSRLGADRIDKLTAEERKAFDNAFVIEAEGLDKWTVKAFHKRMLKERKYPNSTDQAFYALVYDAFYLYLTVTGQMFSEGRTNELADGLALWKMCKLRSFWGVTGHVLLDQNADRFPHYLVEKMKNGKLENMIFLDVLTDCLSGVCFSEEDQYFGVMQYRLEAVRRTDDAISLPSDMPTCGFKGEKCDNSTYYIIGTALVACGLVAAIAFCSYRRLVDMSLYSMSWRVRLSDLQGNPTGSGVVEAIDELSAHNDAGKQGQTPPQITVGNDPCVLATYKQNKTLVFGTDKLKILRELKGLSLHQENLNQFIGLCFNESNGIDEQLIVMWKAADRGTLWDVIFKKEWQLESLFQLSFMRDIIYGLDFIHNSGIGAHGALTTENCFINSHWLVKLSNFGVQPILYDLSKNSAIEYDQPPAQKLLEMAPELLREKAQSMPLRATKEGDVFGFGIIMYQILFRFEPFAYGLVSAEDILEQVIEGAHVTPQIPHNTHKEISLDLMMFMKTCWSKEPEGRPQLSDLKNMIQVQNPSKGNLVDQMMHMMERYAGNLEKQVKDRTAALEEAQQKADLLLLRMLPRSVAKQLKAGKSVKPQTYRSATVLFSDIVQFTKLCSESSPLEIVDFLNSLFSKIDDIIDQHDAYKVETIGDAYLIVSGLPKQNYKRHAWNIADIALCMCECVSKFTIPHKPERTLQIRCGAHSGSVATGVIGNTTPRYCLFGDTVNTASRMESTGEPQKVQISESTRDLLLDYKEEFCTVERGMVAVKGKGELNTYWLSRNIGPITPLIHDTGHA